MNGKNLIPNSERSPSEVRENGRKGGIASGIARREKKTVQKILNDFLEQDVSESQQFNKLAKKIGIESDKSIKDLFTVVCLMNTIKKGDLQDLERLTKLLGEQGQPSENENDNMVALADLINKPKPNRNIADFEDAENE